MTLALTGIVLTAGCTSQVPQGASATRVLQSVAVDVDSSGAITAIEGDAVYLDASSGNTTSVATVYSPNDVADDLPVRVTTEYRTDETTGANLSELAGFSGRVEIEVTLENLTIAPSDVVYTAEGQPRAATALVGTPLSVVASTQLTGVDARALVSDSDEAATTNGVVTSTEEGDAVVQWATLLAPPQSEATATFRLVADVEDFSVPEFDIAVETGLHTDLSFEGVLTSALEEGAAAERALQERAITLASDVNSVLDRAGATITEVRENLDDTSVSLGVKTAEQLASSSDSLATEMQGVAQQLTALDQELGGTVTSARSEMSTQLAQIVASMSDMLGDTTGAAPRLVEGQGCSATVVEGDQGSGLFSTLLTLSARLDGYAQASDGCRDEIVADIEKTLGPANPTAADCVDTSMTCVLFNAENSVQRALSVLVEAGQSIVANIDVDSVDAAISAYGDLGDALALIDSILSILAPDRADSSSLAALGLSVDSARDAATDLAQLGADVSTVIAALDGGPGSVIADQGALADTLCTLAGANRADIDRLRAELVSTPCPGTNSTTTVPAGSSLTDRLAAQAATLRAVSQALATDSTSEISALGTGLDDVRQIVDDIMSINGDPTTTAGLLDKLRQGLNGIRAEHTNLGARLEAILSENQTLAGEIDEAFDAVADKASSAVSDDLENQVRTITDRVHSGRDQIMQSYAGIVDGLSSASDRVVSDGREQINTQKQTFEAAQASASVLLDERTAGALELISAGTTASTRDVEGASSLLAASLNKVIVNFGDTDTKGAGIRGAISAGAASSDAADDQLARASQQVAGYANARGGDDGIMLRKAQFQAALKAAAARPAFHLDVPAGATSQTVYTFHVGAERK